MSTTAMPAGTTATANGVVPAPIVAAPAVANAGPLGLFAFATTTFMLSMVNAKLVNKGVEPIVYGTALTFGGVAQLLCGMWELRNGKTFTGVLFSTYGAFWLSFWALIQFFAKGIPVAQVGNAVGLYLIAWGLVTIAFFAAALVLPKAVTLTLGLLTVTFFLLGIGNAGAHTNLLQAGGYVGLATAAGAAYVGLSELTEATFGRVILPRF